MPNFTGNLKGTTTSQTLVCLNDTPEHTMILRSSTAQHTSSDEHFNHTRHITWGTADLIRGQGHERGYFMSEHSNGDCDCGTFECKVSTNANGLITVEGTWKFTHGTGQFTGITGNGSFKGRMISPTESESTYEGSYQLKAGTRAA